MITIHHISQQLISTHTKVALIAGGLLLLFITVGFLSQKAHAVPTTLGPNDVVIITANADSSWSPSACTNGLPGGPHSNAIDLLLRRDIGPGTEIKITDNAWTGSALTTNEGTITYTAATDLPAGTVIRYSDCLYNQGGSGWTRSTPANGFDTAVGGDTLLVYQGLEAAPSFIYGFGFRTNSWITSGATTSSNSYLPAELSGAHVTMTNARNYQYVVSGQGIYSSTFLTDLQTPSNWSINGGVSAGVPFGPSPLTFDAERPVFNSAVRQSPSDATTTASTVTFRITTSEPVQALAVSDFTVVTTGTLAYGTVMTTAIGASTYDVVISGITGEGTIALAGFTGVLVDTQGNPADSPSFTSESYTIVTAVADDSDTTSPVQSTHNDMLKAPDAGVASSQGTLLTLAGFVSLLGVGLLLAGRRT